MTSLPKPRVPTTSLRRSGVALCIATLGLAALAACSDSEPLAGASTTALESATAGTSNGASASPAPASGTPGSTQAGGDARSAPEEEPSAEHSAEDPSGTEQAGPPESAGPTEPVPAPGGGTITEEIEVEEQEVLPEVPVTDPVEVDGDFEVKVLDIATTEATARAPGEIAGPAMLVEVRLVNNTKGSIDLSAVTVAAEDEHATPLSPLLTDPAEPFFGALAAGDSATAVYLFSFPEGSSTPVKISVNPAPEAPVAVFVGELS